MADWRYNTIHSYLRHEMGKSGQVLSPSTFVPIATEERARLAPEPVRIPCIKKSKHSWVKSKSWRNTTLPIRSGFHDMYRLLRILVFRDVTTSKTKFLRNVEILLNYPLHIPEDRSHPNQWCEDSKSRRFNCIWSLSVMEHSTVRPDVTWTTEW
jgi:hypothetical protein